MLQCRICSYCPNLDPLDGLCEKKLTVTIKTRSTHQSLAWRRWETEANETQHGSTGKETTETEAKAKRLGSRKALLKNLCFPSTLPSHSLQRTPRKTRRHRCASAASSAALLPLPATGEIATGQERSASPPPEVSIRLLFFRDSLSISRSCSRRAA
jgi:hypothetical protein